MELESVSFSVAGEGGKMSKDVACVQILRSFVGCGFGY